MTNRSTVNSETILGTNYQVINLTSNEYNPQIDNQITLTCEVLDVYGDPVEGYEVQLFKNGTSMGSSYSGLTNSSGIRTFTVDCDEWGLIDYSVLNNHCQVQVTGFKTITTSQNNYYTLSVDESSNRARLKVIFNSKNVASSLQAYVVNSFIPSEYRPKNNIIKPLTRDGAIFLFSWASDGTIGVSNGTSSQYSLTCDVQLDYTF